MNIYIKKWGQRWLIAFGLLSMVYVTHTFDLPIDIEDVWDEGLFLETDIDDLWDKTSPAVVADCIGLLSNPSDKVIFLKALLNSKRLATLSCWFLERVFSKLWSYETDECAAAILDNLFEQISTKGIVYLIAKLSLETEKITYLKKLLESKTHEQVDLLKFKNALQALSFQERDYLIKLLLENFFDTLSDAQVAAIITYLSEEKKAAWLEKLIRKHSFVALCVNNRAAKGPLFSNYASKHVATILDCVYSTYATEFKALANTSVKMKNLEQMFKKLVQFTAQEYKKGNIVFYHGQQSQWPFLEMLFNELCTIRYGLKTSPQDFVRFRFTQKSLLTDAEVQEIRTYGITYYTFQKYRFKVLFTNLHVLANYRGSNSFLYVASNLDQAVRLGRFDFGKGIEDIFTEFSLTQEYQFLLSEDPTVFDALYDAYNESIQEQGNIGRLIAISVPQAEAKRLSYSTRSGAGLEYLLINNNWTTDVVEIANNFDQVPFENEFCVILSKEISNPAEAYKTGVRMVSFDAIDESCQKFVDFKIRFRALSERICKKYTEPKPDLVQELYDKIKIYVGYLATQVAQGAQTLQQVAQGA